MTKKDISELTRRFKKDECTFTKMCGCYVGVQKNIVLHINETFLNLKDEEYHKYLEIAKKSLSGTVGNNLLELSFMEEEENTVGKQNFLLALRDSKLKNEELLLRLYELIIDNYEYVGNYLILIFHDAYDVISKTNDNEKLDESEEVYDYLLCAICPVELTKAGLGYREDENRFGARVRDWVVTVPEVGFVFPSFSERSSDVNSVIYYTKNVKEPNTEFMESVLGCKPKRTATEEKNKFQTILQDAIGVDDDKSNSILMEIQQNLSNIIDEHNNIYEKEPFLLTEAAIKNIVAESGISEEVAEKIQKYCTDEFGDTLPVAKNLIDTKALADNAKKVKEQELQKELIVLKQQLEETKAQEKVNEVAETDTIEETINSVINGFDILIKVSPEKATQIKSQVIDGKECIVIPIDANEQAKINTGS